MHASVFSRSPLRASAPPRETSPPSPRAFTLVEMLIAMVLTLILVYALAEFYAYVGETIKDGRAMITMSSQLRAAIQRLKADLDLVTAPLKPPLDDSSGLGYFEIAEGAGKDWDPLNDRDPSHPQLQHKSNLSNAALYQRYLLWESLYGDIDDVIAFTARNKREPWVGQVLQVNSTSGQLIPDPANTDSRISKPQALPAPSFLAEIVWWTNFVDSPLNNGIDVITNNPEEGWWQLNEPRILQRRQLLVRPDLNVVYPGDAAAGPYYFKVPSFNPPTNPLDYFTLMQFCDVSIRYKMTTGGFDYYVANSLSDLSRRENRFMHRFDTSDRRGFPNFLDLNPNYAGNPGAPRFTPPFFNSSDVNTYSQYRWVLDGDRRGEDVMVSNLLGFDVRVFDPTVPLLADNSDPYHTVAGFADDPLSVIQPGDPGWHTAASDPATYKPVGFGAYVDLHNYRYAREVLGTFSATPPAGPFPRFAGYKSLPFQPTGFPTIYPMDYKSQLENDHPVILSHQQPPPNTGTLTPPNFTAFAYYDTWAQSYEKDSIDQNRDGFTDEGTDGLDSPETIPGAASNPNFRNGVDDVNERETAPPYAYPLRGIEVTIRMYEPGTRQVRQATVGADFIPD